MAVSSTTSPRFPRNRMRPPAIRPGGEGMSPMMERLVTDLPEPDSPTTARVSPRRTVSETPSTDLTNPPSVWKCVRRSSTDSTRSSAKSFTSRS